MKPAPPQGTRDFNSETVRKREHILHTIRNVFELYGFQPLETPAMENLDTLLGKYGDEGDRLIFKILKNGLDSSSRREYAKLEFEKIVEGKNSIVITDKALRYDLTIPFARYVAMNYGQLTFPFKRYQVQPVWRADRPQRGRYREFYQCDADIVGSNSLSNEAELANIYADVFRRLEIDVDIRINSRKILTALAEICGGAEKMMDITVAIDKLDKIGIDAVKMELMQRGLNESQINTIEKYLNISGTNEEKLFQLRELTGTSSVASHGMEELKYIYEFMNCHSATLNLQFDFSLARGLNYYTGIIFEVMAKHVQMGSIGGGGRYDNLTGLFGVPNLPGVGISFGVDRIYDVMEELKLFPASVQTGTQVLFFNLGEEESRAAYGLMQQLRARDVKCEIYHEVAKFDKQFKYAEKKNISYAVIIGSKEIEEKTCVIRNLKQGEQKIISVQDLLGFSFA